MSPFFRYGSRLAYLLRTVRFTGPVQRHLLPCRVLLYLVLQLAELPSHLVQLAVVLLALFLHLLDRTVQPGRNVRQRAELLVDDLPVRLEPANVVAHLEPHRLDREDVRGDVDRVVEQLLDALRLIAQVRLEPEIFLLQHLQLAGHVLGEIVQLPGQLVSQFGYRFLHPLRHTVPSDNVRHGGAVLDASE